VARWRVNTDDAHESRDIFEIGALTSTRLSTSGVEVEGDLAKHTCYYQAAPVRHGTPAGDLYIGGSTYRDQLCRTSAGVAVHHQEVLRPGATETPPGSPAPRA